MRFRHGVRFPLLGYVGFRLDTLTSKMAMSETKSDFFHRVWDVVARIPPGKVTTYGHIAEHLSVRSAARTVG